MPNKPKPPCKNCKNREILCHSVCARWKQYEQEKAEMIRERDMKSTSYEYLRYSESRHLNANSPVYKYKKR